MYLQRCMGIKKFEEKCQKCARLPRTEKEENGKMWRELKKDDVFCSSFMPMKEEGNAHKQTKRA